MYSYNRYIAKLIGSIINQATALDSINDVFITSAVFGSIFIGQLIRFPIDGIIGIVIALMIMYTGFKVAKDTVSVLLGNAPDPKLVKKIEAIVKNNPVVLNTHDLIVHDYGPGKSLASIHVEVLENMKLVEAHRIVDLMEQKVLKDLGVDIVIHIDPVKIEEHPKE
jgi:cation diffusion facilitator family transporter